MAATKVTSILRSQTPKIISIAARTMSGGKPGDGAGKGGGAGGSIREAGGAFGKMEAAHEDQYFYELQKEQLQKLKDLLEDEVVHHEHQIKHHQAAIENHKRKIERLHKKTKDVDHSD